jgi:hypothetical protein
MAVPQTTLIQLPDNQAARYLHYMYSRGSAVFKRLFDDFTSQGFQFLYERGKVFMYSGAGTPSIDAGVLGILPSYVPVRATDPHHIAIGLAVHNSGRALACRVKVNHNPFIVGEFELYENIAGNIATSRISAADLDSLSREDAARQLGIPSTSVQMEHDAGYLSSSQLEGIIRTTFEQIIHDKYASPLYPPAGLASLLNQIPLYQKLALSNGIRYSMAMNRIKTCGCSCSCCNGCTTTSCVVEF